MKEIKFLSPCEGKVISIEDFPDEIIASRDMGDGFGVEITNNKIVAPFDGVVSSIYPTAHAICLSGDSGINIMIHIGIDSYKIKDINKAHVKAGDRINKGEVLITTNFKKLLELTGNTATAVVFLDGENVSLIKPGSKIDILEEVADVEVVEQ